MSYETPECFGKHWDQNEPECAGGRDPNKVDSSGNHIRERCTFFTSCGARTAALKQEESRRSLIPVTSLRRPEQKPVPSFTVPGSSASSYSGPSSYEVQQLRAQLEQQTQIIKQQQQALLQRQSMNYQSPQTPNVGYVPANQLQMMAMDMTVPKYLTVPEPIKAGEPVWGALGRTIVRSMIKAVGHTVANFADHNPLDRDDIYKNRPE